MNKRKKERNQLNGKKKENSKKVKIERWEESEGRTE